MAHPTPSAPAPGQAPLPDTFPPLVLDGWFMLHQFFRLDPGVATDPDEGFPSRVEAFSKLMAGWAEPADGSTPEGGWSGFYRVVGGEADYLVLHLRPTLAALGDAERAVARSPLAADLIPAGDYLSVVELGLYALTDALLTRAREEGIQPGTPAWAELTRAQLEAERTKRYVQARLKPLQPEGMPWLCFYPMDKRRNVGQNWYTQPLAERARLMAEHGGTGRRYAGRISQIISGSVGFDDWEWAVTLFAGDPLDFKALVTEMRYDEVTSIYGEFGPFRVAERIPLDRLPAELAGEGR